MGHSTPNSMGTDVCALRYEIKSLQILVRLHQSKFAIHSPDGHALLSLPKIACS